MTAAASNVSTPLATVLDRLRELGKAPKQRGANWDAKCPAHEDGSPSLRVSQGADGRAVVYCHAGCKNEAVVEALGLEWADLFPPRPMNGNGPKPQRDPKERPLLEKTYDYTDADGNVVMQALRLRYTNGEKTFRQRRPDPSKPGEWINNVDGVEPVLYHLPRLLESLAAERRVYIVEGEKDVETLESLGYTATTNVGGAGKWKDSYSALFANADVAILPDNDEPGKAHAQAIAQSLAAVGATVRVVELPGLPPKGDVTDWLADASHTEDDLATAVNTCRLWTLDPSKRTRWRLDELLDNDEVMRPPVPVVPRLAWGARSTLLAARDKAGKSTLIGYIAAAVSRGGAFLDERCAEGTVLLFGFEEFIGDPARRLRHFGADPKKLYIVDKLLSQKLEDRLAEMRAHVDAVKPALVVIDTLIAYSLPVVTDLNNAAQVGPVVQGITNMTHETGVATILAHHAQKNGDGGYRDSTAIGGGVDVVAEISIPQKDADPTLRKVRVVGRVPTRHFAFRFDGNHYLLDELASLHSNPTNAPATDLSLDDRILAAVRSRPGCTTNTIVDVVRANRQEVTRRIAAMCASRALIDDGDSDKGRRLYLPHSAVQRSAI